MQDSREFNYHQDENDGGNGGYQWFETQGQQENSREIDLSMRLPRFSSALSNSNMVYRRSMGLRSSSAAEQIPRTNNRRKFMSDASKQPTPSVFTYRPRFPIEPSHSSQERLKELIKSAIFT